MARRIASLAVLLCLLLVSSAAAGGAAATQADAVSLSTAQPVEQQGDLITSTVGLNGTDRARLQIDAAQRGFSATVLVIDGSGDGQVTVTFDTLRADDPSAAFGAADAEDTVIPLSQSVTLTPSTLPTGRYNLIASVDGTRVADAVWVEEPSARGSAVCAVPPDTRDADIGCETGVEGGDNASSVAIGDTGVVEYRVSGLESLLRTAAPGEQLIFANDSTPGARTTHVLQHSPESNATGRTLRVQYASETTPSLQGADPIERVGIDTTGNGAIDRPLSGVVDGYRITSGGELSVNFAREVSVAADETLLFEYNVVNPRATGESEVTARFGGTETAGEVRYGPVGQGTLGNGIDLRIDGADTRFVAPLSALDAAYDARSDTLEVTADTTVLETGAYNVTLVVDSEAYPNDDRIALTERMRIDEPSVHELSTTVDGGRLDVTARTNLAPGNDVTVELTASQNGLSYLSRCFVTVENGTISCGFEPPVDGEVSVSVVHDGTTMAGPTTVEVSRDA